MKKTITVLLAFLMLFFCLIPTFITHADSGYNEAYDSFAVSEEYRTMASCYDLVQLMKMKYPEMDDGRVYRVCYDAMYVTWEANGSFENDLEKGEVTVNEKTLRFVNLTVPIVEEENGSCVANAQIDRNGAVEVSLQSDGTIVTRQLYDEGLFSDGDTLPKGYTVMYWRAP